MNAHEMYPCPCPGCDGESLDPDAYCTKCMHEGCGIEPECTENEVNPAE